MGVFSHIHFPNNESVGSECFEHFIYCRQITVAAVWLTAREKLPKVS